MIKNNEEENYQKFLKGAFWIKGWNVRVKEVEMKRLLSELGEKIGREWAKDKGIRKIDSGMLKKWGSELQEAISVDPARLVKQLRILEHDVNKIISENS
jgi:hypothetical protein